MPTEPENLALELLREMRSDARHLRDRSDEQAEQLKQIRKDMHNWPETTATAVGFATHANIRIEAFDQRIEDIAKRLERLEARA